MAASPQDAGGILLAEVLVRSGGLKRSGTFSGVRDRATALMTILRWPVIFCQLFGEEGTQDLQSDSALCVWKMS